MDYTKELLSYISKATTAVTAVSAAINKLEGEGFESLSMGAAWMVSPGGKYYVRPFPGTFMAFTIGDTNFVQRGFRIITSHTDSPCFRVKGNPEVVVNGYLKLNVDVYGGPILYSWFDRPLSLGGQVVLKSEDTFKPKVVEVDFRRPLMTIPSLAIHFDRRTNDALNIDRQKNLLPILGLIEDTFESEGYLYEAIAKEVGCKVEDILDVDLFFMYVAEQGHIIGMNEEMLSAPRLDNQAMVYSSIEALMSSDHKDGINLVACFDNEEIGSSTKQGADSILLHQIVERISFALKKQPQQLYRMYDSSFIISGDGLMQATPMQQKKNDITSVVKLGQGVTIKYSMNQQYSTDAISAGAFMQLCEKKAGVKVQKMFNRSGIPGGKSLGPLTDKYLPIDTVDVGIPMLAMHSAKEVIGISDLDDCIKVLEEFFGES